MTFYTRSLVELNIHHLRNISEISFQPNPQCNLFYGSNGSGKTSLLESIYLLTTGHSFRTRETSPLVSHGEQAFVVFARTLNNDTISIQKSLSGPTQVKVNAQICHSSSELAHFLPCQVFYQDIFHIIDAGPSLRRNLLDWGMFHVEHSYHAIWKDYRTVLRQRNALLRQKASRQQFAPWDKQLVTLSNLLDTMRSSYFKRWSQLFQSMIQKMTDVPCSIDYFKGWDRKNSGTGLSEILETQFTTDLQRQYTYSGAHQADITFELSSKKAKLLLSRGQQKIVLIALKLAQAQLVTTGCIYLFDDISAELDNHHLSRLLSVLGSLRGQLFLTTLEEAALKGLDQFFDLNTFSLRNGVIAGS